MDPTRCLGAALVVGLLGSVACCARSEAGPPAASPAQVSAPAAGKPAGAVCDDHAQCASGVCSRLKKDMGECAEAPCQPGTRTDNNHFYCAAGGAWAPTRQEGEACQVAHECYAPTCFMDPNCQTRPREEARCEQGRCRLVAPPDECTAKGWVKTLHPAEYLVDGEGRCMQSLAQRELRAVCVPCGNGRCDADESHCNCPEDCPKSAPR